MEKTTRETVNSMSTDWDIPEGTQLLAYSIAYRFKAEVWRKQTREQFLEKGRRLQSLFQPTKALAATDFGERILILCEILVGVDFFMLPLSSVLMFPAS